MGYKYKIIDDRRQEAPFLILEKDIYQNLNVCTLAQIVDVYSGGYKLKSIPKGIMFESNYVMREMEHYIEDRTYTVDEMTYVKGDLVLVIMLDNYGTEELTEVTETIMHDYRNAVILGKVNKLKSN